MADPNAATPPTGTPIATIVTGAPVVTSPTPGWKTSEFWITLIVILIGALPSSGLIAEGSQAAKIVGLAISVLGGLGYMQSRTSLKKAHVWAASEPANDNAACPTCGHVEDVPKAA